MIKESKKYVAIEMEMPESCAECRFCSYIDEFKCRAMPPDRDDVYMELYFFGEEDTPKPDDCPLLEVQIR